MSDPAHIFKPSLRAFGLRCVGLFLITFLMLTPAWPFVGGLAATITAIILSLTYMFVLDDFSDWMRHRHATWTLTPSALIYENPSEDMMPHTLPLSEITAIKRRFFWSLVVRLQNGQAITMAYIDTPKQTRTLIQNAITAAPLS
jgi:hypothetical protein